MPLLNLVEHACSVGMLGTVGVGGAECEFIRDMRYMPNDGHLAAHKFLINLRREKAEVARKKECQTTVNLLESEQKKVKSYRKKVRG